MRDEGEGGQPLELLLALSHAYRVPLDDLVAAPVEGDPRVRLKPGRVKGRTVIPLTRQPDAMQAWKIVIPTSKTTQSHGLTTAMSGYVLSGHLRFVLGDQDLVLGPGEVASFDTKVPHWFGSTGDEPAEILNTFGRPRINVPDSRDKTDRRQVAGPHPGADACRNMLGWGGDETP